jgi:glucuronate isomerase
MEAINMKKFLDDDFLLENRTASKLYHRYAENTPILDYHCHLNPAEIAEDKQYRNITELWLGGDHYKWRAMRSNGIEESYITGDADDKLKFFKWAETIPQCIGNPLYHWTHLELKRYFGIDELLCPQSAEKIWDSCNAMLKTPDFTARSLIKRSNVKALCTTDDPVDDLSHHTALKQDKTFNVKVFPAFRPDKAINIDKSGFNNYIRKLAEVSGVDINGIEDVKDALLKRLEYFHSAGCRISDHALDPIVYHDIKAGNSGDIANRAFLKAMEGKELTGEETGIYKTEILLFLGRQYARLGWVMQLHMDVIRNNNTRMMNKLGPDTGFDAIGDWNTAQILSRFLDSLDETGELPKTILYSLNPSKNEILGTIMGCFQGEGTPGKIQLGSAWWFNDQKDGMEKQLIALANLGLLSRFVGMLTDSRSFLSYTRHEYFRRILCNLLGKWVENGEAPNDMDFMGKIVMDICYNNAVKYFELP